MPKWWRLARGIATAVALAGYMIVSHRISTAPSPPGPAAVAFAAAPLLAVVAVLAWHSHRWRRWLAIVFCIAAGAFLWIESPAIGRHITLLYLLQGACTDAALMLMFGGSLAAGRVPLCSRLAASVRGTLTPPVARYTRQLTVAWTAFFAAMIVVSLTLYVRAPVTVWSAFANLLPMPLVGIMFVAEYAVRRRVLRDVPHSPLAASLRAWWNSGGLSAPPR